MYKYEMHMHSSPCSGGGCDIELHIDNLVKKGFAGMVITNHFFRGDTRIDRNLPWNEFCDSYRDDYLRGKAYAEKHDFDLLFGLEEGAGEGKEILVYGITPDFMYDERLRNAPTELFIKLAHEAGGLVFQAHPFRNRSYIPVPGLIPEFDMLDGIEVYNTGNTPEANEQARLFVQEHPQRCTVGSDGHSPVGGGRTAIVAKQRIRTEKALVEVLKSRDYELYIEEN
ncbi:MAG: PHP domain-containing protein [Clostridia bacterium]|nr:PHP domain-containing protein [Clostridia bacterium]